MDMNTAEAESQIEQRRQNLKDIFEKYGLDTNIRSDTCLQYIYLGDNAFYNDPEKIARVFCETKFLNEYCNVPKGTRLAKERCVNVRLPRETWLERLKMYILGTENYTGFPEEWPWLNGVMPKYKMDSNDYVFFDKMKIIRKGGNRFNRRRRIGGSWRRQ